MSPDLIRALRAAATAWDDKADATAGLLREAADALEARAPVPPVGGEGGEDLSFKAETVGWIRDAAERVTGGNCTFVDDDLHILEHLATRAVDAGLTEGLHPAVAAKAAAASAARAAASQDRVQTQAEGGVGEAKALPTEKNLPAMESEP